MEIIFKNIVSLLKTDFPFFFEKTYHCKSKTYLITPIELVKISFVTENY